MSAYMEGDLSKLHGGLNQPLKKFLWESFLSNFTCVKLERNYFNPSLKHLNCPFGVFNVNFMCLK